MYVRLMMMLSMVLNRKVTPPLRHLSFEEDGDKVVGQDVDAVDVDG